VVSAETAASPSVAAQLEELRAENDRLKARLASLEAALDPRTSTQRASETV
jgi:BMFP domain-containing protein YqiC